MAVRRRRPHAILMTSGVSMMPLMRSAGASCARMEQETDPPFELSVAPFGAKVGWRLSLEAFFHQCFEDRIVGAVSCASRAVEDYA